MNTISKKSFGAADETTHPGERLTLETVDAGGVKVVRVTAEPGWQWSKHLKPVKKTDSCQMHHVLYMISGTLGSRMEGGEDMTFRAGEIVDIPPVHDGWTVGDEPAVWLELPHP